MKCQFDNTAKDLTLEFDSINTTSHTVRGSGSLKANVGVGVGVGSRLGNSHTAIYFTNLLIPMIVYY